MREPQKRASSLEGRIAMSLAFKLLTQSERSLMTQDEQWPAEIAERVVVIARLKEGGHDRAAELIAAGPPFDPDTLGFERHAVYLSATEVAFLFEGSDTARRLADVMDDMVTSASFSAWAPLLEGTPRLAHEFYFWQRQS
jgi:hypothetical protein